MNYDKKNLKLIHKYKGWNSIVSLVIFLIITCTSCGTEESLISSIPLSSSSSEEITCPNGYIIVPANTTLDVTTFCVMKYEAKAWSDTDSDGVVDDGETDADGCEESGCTTNNWGLSSYKPGSGAYGAPWRKINQENAWNECDSLNSEAGNRSNIDNDSNGDGTYALISNPEWMTVARNVENVASNWTSGSVGGSACLFRGNIGSVAKCNGIDSGYNGADPDYGASRSDNDTAQLKLDNEEVIWDFSGNLWEWVDWDKGSTLSGVTHSNKAYVSGDGAPQNAWVELKDLDTNTGNSDEMFTESWQATNSSLDSNNGIGKYIAGNSTSSSTKGAALRGGTWNSYAGGGAFSLYLHYGSTFVYENIGFRCVHRP